MSHVHHDPTSGFLIVLQAPADSQNPKYSGAGRVPAYPSDLPEEASAMDAYVFGDFKSLDTNLIPSYVRAVELWRAFSESPRRFEILLWCSGPNSHKVQSLDSHRASAIPLGFDVSTLGGYWSIVDDMERAPWADKFRAQLNEFGLFSNRETAAQYLDEYIAEKSADWDMEFHIGFVLRVVPSE